MATVTNYALYLESGPKQRKTMVHALDLLGCVAVGPTTQDALAATPDTIRAYLRFLRRHGEAVADPTESFETHVAQHIMEGDWLGNGSPYLLFDADLEPVTADELEIYIQRAQWMTTALADWAETRSPAELNETGANGGRTSLAILRHVLGAQGVYFAAALGGAPGFSALASSVERGERDIADALRQSAEMLAARARAVTPEQRAAVRFLPKNSRTFRKGLRRTLEHEWEHLAELSRREGGPML
ncbi:MAG TPA: DinB family protein [Ktedonobacterales bacterium]